MGAENLNQERGLKMPTTMELNRISGLTITAIIWSSAVFSFGAPAQAQSSVDETVHTELLAVTDFPDPGPIDDVVAVQFSHLVAVRDVTVPPVPPNDNTRWIDAGVMRLGAFREVVLSLHGVVIGSVTQPGTVGAVLIPEEPTIIEAFEIEGQVHFSLQVTAAGVTSQTPYFASNQRRHTVAFGEYRVWFYNSTDRTVTTSLFAYLSN